MQILLTGGTGFIGQALVPALLERGCELLLLSRSPHPDAPSVRYLRSLDEISPDTSLDAVINLAGASLAGRRWSADYKREIVDSRLETTRALLALAGRLDHPPGVLLSGSAVGYYGHHADELLDEDAHSTPGFAQALCANWEDLAEGMGDLGTRVCRLRLGVVLDRAGGAWPQMARSFQFGLGSWIGDGRQWLSWIHRRDVVAAVLYLLDTPVLTGPFNLTAPAPVTSREFCEVLQRHYRTALALPVPAAAMRLLVGEMAGELLLSGQRVIPARLTAAGFGFSYPTLDAAVAEIRAKP